MPTLKLNKIIAKIGKRHHGALGIKLVRLGNVNTTAITSAAAALSFELGGVAITGGGITFAHGSSANGTTYSSEPTALNTVNSGDTIEMITDGGSTNAVLAEITFIIRR